MCDYSPGAMSLRMLLYLALLSTPSRPSCLPLTPSGLRPTFEPTHRDRHSVYQYFTTGRLDGFSGVGINQRLNNVNQIVYIY